VKQMTRLDFGARLSHWDALETAPESLNHGLTERPGLYKVNIMELVYPKALRIDGKSMVFWGN